MKTLLSLVVAASLAWSAGIDIDEGKRLYEETCISCHGINGEVNTEIKLVVRPRDLRKTILEEEQMYKIIKHGAHYWGAAADIMPSFENIYDDHQLRSIARYIAVTFNPEVQKRVADLYAQSDAVPAEKEAKMLKRGQKIFKRNCGWCHGMDGKGDGEATRNPEKSIYPYDLTSTLLSEKQFFLYVKYGGKFWGTNKNHMPAWGKSEGGKYDDYSLKSVAKYVYEVVQKKDK
jgi:mono/diheme cytochrome c family protein